jgi:hypothetical protein
VELVKKRFDAARYGALERTPTRLGVEAGALPRGS